MTTFTFVGAIKLAACVDDKDFRYWIVRRIAPCAACPKHADRPEEILHTLLPGAEVQALAPGVSHAVMDWVGAVPVRKRKAEAAKAHIRLAVTPGPTNGRNWLKSLTGHWRLSRRR